MKTNLMPLLITGAVTLGTGFFAGMKYDQSKQPALSEQGRNFMQGAGRNGGNRMGFRPVSGEIISSDSTSITVKLPDGSSKIVLLSDKTIVNKADPANKSDLKTGEKVAVFGQENSDGSVTAQTIQLNPLQMLFRGQNSVPSALPTPAL